MDAVTGPAPEFSIVMPCLNEAETLEACILSARKVIASEGLSAEIILADNGSTDGSVQIAETHGVRVVRVSDRGYGSAIRGGIRAARGKYIIICDSDGSHDMSEIGRFVEKLRQGFDLVVGSRFKGKIDPGSMPWANRRIGNPVLTGIGRLLFCKDVSDFHCGFRGISVEALRRLVLVTTGMEFASEMLIKAALCGLKIAEVPVTQHKDGRSRPPHLRRWRDGWRHLRFMLLYSPVWLFMAPGFALMLLSALGFALVMPGLRFIVNVGLDVNALVVASAMGLLGFQLVSFGLFAQTFAASAGLLPHTPNSRWVEKRFSLERFLVLGLVMVAGGLLLFGKLLLRWRAMDYGVMSYSASARLVVPGVTLLSLGVQVIFTSFCLSVVRLPRRPDDGERDEEQ